MDYTDVEQMTTVTSIASQTIETISKLLEGRKEEEEGEAYEKSL